MLFRAVDVMMTNEIGPNVKRPYTSMRMMVVSLATIRPHSGISRQVLGPSLQWARSQCEQDGR
jgi:hypothetical protein